VASLMVTQFRDSEPSRYRSLLTAAYFEALDK
jgi:hypothetical protein